MLPQVVRNNRIKLIMTVCNSDCAKFGFQFIFKISIICRTYSVWDIDEGISTIRSYIL
jgi:hypothetical protein